jgi:hypothetical protein
VKCQSSASAFHACPNFAALAVEGQAFDRLGEKGKLKAAEYQPVMVGTLDVHQDILERHLPVAQAI